MSFTQGSIIHLKKKLGLIFSIGIRNVVNVKKIQVYISNIRFGNGVEWGSAMGMSLLLLEHGSSMQVFFFSPPLFGLNM
jgi:hypothetical protein